LASLDADTCQWVRSARDTEAAARGTGQGAAQSEKEAGEPLRSTHGVLLCLARALPRESRHKVGLLSFMVPAGLRRLSFGRLAVRIAQDQGVSDDPGTHTGMILSVGALSRCVCILTFCRSAVPLHLVFPTFVAERLVFIFPLEFPCSSPRRRGQNKCTRVQRMDWPRDRPRRLYNIQHRCAWLALQILRWEWALGMPSLVNSAPGKRAGDIGRHHAPALWRGCCWSWRGVPFSIVSNLRYIRCGDLPCGGWGVGTAGACLE